MAKLFVAPDRRLAGIVDRIWTWRNESSLPSLVPGTGHDVLFNLGDPLILEDDSGSSVLPSSFVCVRFKSGKFSPFYRGSVQDLADSFIPCRDLWGNSVLRLETQLQEMGAFSDQAVLLGDFFAERSVDENPNRPAAWIDHAIDRLYYGFNKCSVESLAAEISVSRRQLERKCVETVGAGPKAFQRTARFQSVLRDLLAAKSRDYLDTALGAGFFDQAHFINEFKNFTGETPGQFLVERNFSSHFYNKRISL